MADDSPRSRPGDGTDAGALVGARMERREDRRLLTGRAAYTDDHHPPGTAVLAFVRSQYAHADLRGVDVGPATARDGVLAAYTWEDIEASGAPGVLPIASSQLEGGAPGHPVLARERVRYQGQPVAAVVAEDRYAARDGVAAVDVDYDRRPAVTDPVAATGPDAPTLFDGSPDNVAVEGTLGDADETAAAFAAADRVVERDLVNNRLIPNALEPRGALAEYDPADDRLTVTMTSQSPHGHRSKLSATLGRPEQRIRVVAPDVGGGFGHKGHHHPGEAMAAWAALRLERPVKWQATRTENYLAGAHGRDHVTEAALAFDDDGRVRGLRVDTHAGVGGYGLGGAPGMVTWYGSLLSSQYRIPAIHCRARSVFTTTTPVHSYRGAGRPEAVYVTERLVDAAARELGVDPVELRRRNLVREFPYETPVGATYDSGDYERALDRALEVVGYEAFRERQREARPDRLLGVGVAGYVESTGGGYESGVVRVHPGGGVTVYAGTHSHGQGHATTYAQIVADELGVGYDDIEVVEGDTAQVPEGTGTFGSRSTIVGGSAIAESAGKVREKARRIAAAELEVAPEDVAFDDGTFHVAGAPGRGVEFDAVAEAAHGWGRPEGIEPGLEATTFYEPDGTAYSFGTHVAVVEVDPDTGGIEFERYLAVDDCGERINPTLVEGQVHGGVAQGIGQARFEHAVYDDGGNLATGSLQDYAVPHIDQLPPLETEATVTPSPNNPLGVKGIGEAGTIAAPPAVVNAVLDALEPLGVDHLDMPLTDETVWQAIRDAEE